MRQMRYVVVLVAVVLRTMACSGQTHRSDVLDDVVQYVPYASVLALKACGADSRDQWGPLLATTAASWVVSASATWTLKHTIHEWRPDSTDRHSFPSGHSAIAFAGATMLRHEYGHVSPWVTVAGYGVATFTAVDRVVRDRHHWYDAAAGAAIGVASAELSWWLSRKVFRNKDVQVAFTGNSIDLVIHL